MSRFVGVIAALLFVACGSSVNFAGLQMGPRRAILEEEIIVRQLANRLRVILVPDPRTNLVTVGVNYDVGGADDPPADAGLAHYVEHVLHEASFRVPGGEGLRDVALASNAFTSFDRTYFYSTALDADLDRILESAARRMELGCSDLDPSALARERDVVIEEMKLRGSWIDTTSRFMTALWGRAHAYSRGPGGSEFADVSKDALCAFMDQHYGPASAVLVVTGNVTAADMERIRARFERIADRPQAPRPLRAPPPSTGTSRATVAGLEAPTLMLVFPVPGEGSDHDAEIALLNGALWPYRDEYTTLYAQTSVIGERRDRVVVATATVTDAKRLPELEASLRRALTNPRFAAFAARRAARRMEIVSGLEDSFETGHELATLAAQHQKVSRFRQLRQLDALVEKDVTNWLDVSRSRTVVLLPEIGKAGTVRFDDVAVSSHQLEVLRSPAPSELDASLLSTLSPRAEVIEYTLANGLRVLLSPDRNSLVLDARLVISTPSQGGARNQLATQAALFLRARSGRSEGADAYERVSWYETIGVPVVPSFEGRATTFGVRGFALFGDWHVWNLAWTVLDGSYPGELDALSRSSNADAELGTRASALAIALQRIAGGTAGASKLVVHPAKVLQEFRRSTYRPERSTLIVAGKFDPVAMRSEIESLFGGWRGANTRTFSSAEHAAQPVVSSAVVVPADDARTVQLAVAFPIGAARTPAREVLVDMLGERLRVIREGLGVSYGVHASLQSNAIVVFGDVDPAFATEAARAIAAEITRIRSWDVDVAADFARARKRALVRAAARPAGARSRANALERIAIDRAPANDLDRALSTVAALDSASVQRAAAELALEHMVVVARGKAVAAEAAVRVLAPNLEIETLR